MCKGTEGKALSLGLARSLAPAAEKGVLREPEETTGAGLVCLQVGGPAAGGEGCSGHSSQPERFSGPCCWLTSGGGGRPSLARLGTLWTRRAWNALYSGPGCAVLLL